LLIIFQFFLGSPFEPCRAGMIAKIFLFLYT
jgi:hypothetical protein